LERQGRRGHYRRKAGLKEGNVGGERQGAAPVNGKCMSIQEKSRAFPIFEKKGRDLRPAKL
jgi:hypothetical protein